MSKLLLSTVPLWNASRSLELVRITANTTETGRDIEPIVVWDFWSFRLSGTLRIWRSRGKFKFSFELIRNHKPWTAPGVDCHSSASELMLPGASLWEVRNIRKPAARHWTDHTRLNVSGSFRGPVLVWGICQGNLRTMAGCSRLRDFRSFLRRK